MPSSAVRTFTDPDDYTAAIRGTTAELTVTGRGEFAAEIVRIELSRMVVTRFRDNLPRVYHSVNFPGRGGISFRTEPGPSYLMSGVEMEPTNLARLRENHESHHHSSGPASIGLVSLPVEDMASIGGHILAPPRETLSVTPPPLQMARLQRLHAAAVRLAETAPEIIANPDAARGLEQAFVEAGVDCLGKARVGEDSVARRQHQLIMRRFHRVLEEKPGESLYITEVCRAIGVSIRTLQMCCQEELGMGPKRYLLLRRLHLARRALRAAAPDATTVTDIATRCGFWHLGRFAGEYRSLFGESPSVMLHRQPE